MALDYCESCQTIEGRWRPITKQEYIDALNTEHGFVEVSDAWEDQVCMECNSLGKTGIPEHDDWDMER